MKEHTITVTINGTKYTKSVEPRLLLSDFIRYNIGLTGTNIGCEHGVCGICNVLLNGEAVRSCLILAIQIDGCEIETLESLTDNSEELSIIQQSFTDNHALQCGFCTSGFIMSLIPFLKENPNPTKDEIREAISGTLCRCTGYANIIKAVDQAAAELRKV